MVVVLVLLLLLLVVAVVVVVILLPLMPPPLLQQVWYLAAACQSRGQTQGSQQTTRPAPLQMQHCMLHRVCLRSATRNVQISGTVD
jgi:hypothetical protein